MPPDKLPSMCEVDLFAALSHEELGELERRVPDVFIECGRIFYTPWYRGENFFLLLEGGVRIYRCLGSREQTVSIVRPGTFFGEAALAALEQGAFAQALEDSRVAIMHRGTLRRLVADSPEVGMMMIEILSERLNVYESRLEEMALREVPARLACLILRMAEDEGVRDDEGYKVPTHYTHELLGTMVGCGRPATTRALHYLRDAGAVRLQGRRIRVVDSRVLEHIAGSG